MRNLIALIISVALSINCFAQNAQRVDIRSAEVQKMNEQKPMVWPPVSVTQNNNQAEIDKQDKANKEAEMRLSNGTKVQNTNAENNNQATQVNTVKKQELTAEQKQQASATNPNAPRKEVKKTEVPVKSSTREGIR